MKQCKDEISPLLFNPVPEFPAIVIKEEKKQKSYIKQRERRNNLYLFADDTDAYIDNSKKLQTNTHKPFLELVNEFSRITGYSANV